MPPVAQAPRSKAQELFDRISGIDADDRTSAERQFVRAHELERQRGELQKLVSANREYLRLMAKNEELSDDLADWLEDFYPEKEKGERRSEDEIERTRKAKEVARKA